MADRLVADAMAFAKERHAGQTYGDGPYHEHLSRVYLLASDALDRFETPLRDCRSEVLAAAWLHDVLEDTETTQEELRESFGSVVTETVFTITGVGRNRQERNASIYRKLGNLAGAALRDFPPGSAAPALIALKRAQLVKLCDRIANVEACWENRDRRLFMYQREHVALLACIWTPYFDDPAIHALAQRLKKLLGDDDVVPP